MMHQQRREAEEKEKIRAFPSQRERETCSEMNSPLLSTIFTGKESMNHVHLKVHIFSDSSTLMKLSGALGEEKEEKQCT